jgi:hypothetical protein
MEKSTHDEIGATQPAAAHRPLPAVLLAVAAGVVGPLVALALGLLTFGVQATVQPHHVPLAVGASSPASASALAPLSSRVASQGGDAVDWRTVGSRAEAESLLDRKEIYGAVLFDPAPGGPTATVLLSGAVNPTATQVAEPLLTRVAETATSAARAQAAAQQAAAAQQPQAAGRAPATPAQAPATPPVPTVRVDTIHPTSAAGRTVPLAASALLWLATLLAGALVAVGPRLRGGAPLGTPARLAAALTAALLGTAVALGLARLWDPGLPIGWDAAGFLALVGVAFALLQTGVLRWLGPAGLAVLVPLYLMAPAVAGVPPELLHPVYRWALWVWTPFRFSTEALRSLLFLGRDAPDVQPALWVFGGIGLTGLVLLSAPRPRRRAVAAGPPGDVALRQGG